MRSSMFIEMFSHWYTRTIGKHLKRLTVYGTGMYGNKLMKIGSFAKAISIKYVPNTVYTFSTIFWARHSWSAGKLLCSLHYFVLRPSPANR